MLAVASFCFLFSITSIWPWLQYILKGMFGVFIYPLCILAMIIAIALLNNKRYVMSKRYAIFLALSVVCALAIVQLIIVGGQKGTFGEYLLTNYHKQNTAGGLLLGFFTTCLLYVVKLPASYVIWSLGLIVSVAFFIEALVSERKSVKESEPVKIQIKSRHESVPRESSIKEKTERVKKPEVNVVLNGNIEQKLATEQSAREKIGLASRPMTREQPKPEEKESKIPAGMSLKEYLLQPPEVDMQSFMAQNRTRPTVNRKEMDTVLSQVKNEQIKPSQVVYEEQFGSSQYEPQKRGKLPEIKPEQIVSEADDIIKSVVKQELTERGIVNEQPPIENPVVDEPIEQPQVDNFARRERNFVNLEQDEPAEPERVEPERKFVNLDENDNDENGEYFDFGEVSRERNENKNINLDRREGRDVFSSRDEGLNRDRREFARETLSRDRSRPIERQTEKQEEKPQTFKPYKYNKPSIDLIKTVSDDPATLADEVPEKQVALENALEKFGIPAKVQSVVVGPTVTRYEIAMPEGISVKRILTLDNDIALTLSARGDIRIEAPIPGRNIVGIEVPNDHVLKVSIKDVLQSKEFSMSPSPLAFALGKDITGTVRVCNLQKMPHLLVAGTTGSGKSVCLNAIIVSILYKASPDDVRFIMIDPKQVELSMYEGLPHMVMPKVITDPVKAVNALQWAVDEMERRFNLISDARLRNLEEYNKSEEVVSGRKKKLPYIVIIFDEFADFMLVSKNEIEDKIRRLAQKARAAGIHLILATQRPSTDVVTGTIKANFPSRIAFKVAGRVDSEVILGSVGAEKLLGYGDMLYKPSDSAPSRIQGCFIDTPETKDIVNYIIENNEETYDEDAINAINGINKPSADKGDEMDPLLPQALKICIDVGVASTTMVQRKLSIGYPRAARIVDQMEQRGYISTIDGSKQRTVYTTIEEFYEIFGDNYD